MRATVKQLEHAMLLASTGSFTRAAEKANLSQSAFSRSIEKLEALLGVPLFDREGRAVSTTVFGEALTLGAGELLERYDEIYREVLNLRGLATGNLAVALGVYPAEIVGYLAVGRMVQQYPQLSIRAHVCNWEEVNRVVLSGEVDLAYAVLDAARRDPRLANEPVASHEKALFVRSGHPLAGEVAVRREQVDDFPLVSIRVPEGLAGDVPGNAVMDPDTGYLLPAVEIDDFTVARGIVANSDAVGITTPLQIETQLAAGDFVLLRYTRPWIAPDYGFIYRENRTLSPAARVFMTLVRDAESFSAPRNARLLDRYLPC